MKTAFICIFALFISLNDSNAAIRRVGFTDVPAVAGVDYPTCYAAHQAAVNGDTILIFPGKTIASGWYENIGDIQISKRVVFISKGFWLDSATTPRGNFALQANKGTGLSGANSAGIKFLAGSAGSTLTGFDLGGTTVRVNASNITIKRNYNLAVSLENVSVSGLVVTGNYRVSFGGNDNVANVWSNVTISNNLITLLWQLPLKSFSGIMSNNTFAYNSTLSTTINGSGSSMSDQLTGNSFENDIYLRGGTWIFENNLLVTLTNNSAASNLGYDFIGAENTIFNNNVAIQASNFTAWPASSGTGNIILQPADVPDIFEAFPAIAASSADGRYRLKAGSPALAGSSARPVATVDAGMYGSSTPYKLGMIPDIPAIYNVSSPQGNNPSGNTLQVILSIRSNN